jgi:isoquinoline 1-oxidoreductase subunit beta
MGMKRRAFLIGGASVVGGGLFALHWANGSAASKGGKMIAKAGESSFSGWIKIATDDTITLYSPHIDFGQGSHTALAQMLADELDADWSKMRTEAAPAEMAFANTALGKGFILGAKTVPAILTPTVNAAFGAIARYMELQITGGSSAIRATGQAGFRVIGAAAREALVSTAAKRLGVPESELTTAESKVTHAKSGKSLRYGELAAEASERSLSTSPKLKTAKDFKYIGKSPDRFDIPAKVNGSAQYGIDYTMPEMRVATIMAAPIRGGKLESVDPAPAMAIKGVEKVIKLDNAVAVVAKGYWAASQGLAALSPKFSDGGNAGISTASIFAEHDKLRKSGKPENEAGNGDVAKGFATKGAKILTADFRVPFLHQAMMEPFALTAHYKEGKLDIWGASQSPLGAKMVAARAAGLSSDDVTFHPMIMGGGFGRRAPQYSEVTGQVAQLAKQLPYPVKLIWSREEDVRQGAYRPQCSAALKAALGADGKIAAWQCDYAQVADAGGEAKLPYDIPNVALNHFQYQTNQTDGFWRSVNSTQHGFYTETFMDELAQAAGVDPLTFRLNHLPKGSRYARVLEEVAKRAGWGTPLPAGVGRGIALVESFGTIVAEVIEAKVGEDGVPKPLRAFAVVDCGTTVNPKNAEAQIEGGLIMGLSSAIGEAITVENGAVMQSNFSDYPILKMAGTPTSIDVHFIESGAQMGGIGEPGTPPATPALVNALFAITGKRQRTLPLTG